jgi:hypothetical protein
MTASIRPRADEPQREELRSPTSADRRWNLEPREAGILATILIATAVVYMPSIRYDWVWDDKAQTVQAIALHSWSGIGKSFLYDSWWFRDPSKLPQSQYYRPLQASWFGLNYMMLGNHPGAWHLEKIIIELIGVVFCFRLAQLLTRNTSIALLTAAIFAMLPANLEAVVWNSAIGEPMSAIFEMGALRCLINRKEGSMRSLAPALLLYAGALLSHETAIVFLLVVVAYLVLIEKKSARETFWLAAPFIVVALLYLCARMNALGMANFVGRANFLQPSVGLGWEKPAPPHGLLGIMMTAPVALLYYLGVLALPWMAGPAHNVGWVTVASPITFVAAGILLLLAAVAILLIRRSRDWRLYAFCAAWSLITLALAMNLKELAMLVQDRVLYAPSFGWSLALAIAAMRIAALSSRARIVVAGAMSLLLVANAVAIERVERYWHDDVTFFTRCVAIAPHHAGYLRGLVDMLNFNGDFDGAMIALRTAVNLEPDNIYFRSKLADQYGLMRRPEDFTAEVLEIRALRKAASRANAAAAASQRAPTAVPSPQ